MTETIEVIEAFEDSDAYGWGREGYRITTSEQQIELSISNGQSCCEDWGYLMSEDNLDKFVGSELLGIEITDTNRTNRTITRNYDEGNKSDDPEWVLLDEGDVMFVDIKTSRGTLQFVAYNAHNGYYGHDAKIVSKQLTHEVTL